MTKQTPEMEMLHELKMCTRGKAPVEDHEQAETVVQGKPESGLLATPSMGKQTLEVITQTRTYDAVKIYAKVKMDFLKFNDMNMEGITEFWYIDQIESRENMLWDQFIPLVRDRFTNADDENLIGKFNKLKQGNKVKEKLVSNEKNLPDFSKEFVVKTDASYGGLGAVLIQDKKPAWIEEIQESYDGNDLVPQLHEKSSLTSDDVNLRINVHYGVPSTALILAFDPIQHLLAIGTLDGRIQVIGGDNFEGLLISPKLLPYKYMEFLQNQGFIVSITNDKDIQVWNQERRLIACSLQWESNVTAFSVIRGSSFMFVGDKYGLVSVLKYDPDGEQLLQLHYELSSESLAEATGVSISNRQPIVGILPQPCSFGNRLLIAYESGLPILWDVPEEHVVVRSNKVLELKNKVVSPNDGITNIVDDAPSHELEEKEISAFCWASTDGSILAVGYVDGDILFWNTSKDSSAKDQEAELSPNVVKLQLSSAEKRLLVIVLHWLDGSKSCKHQEGQLLIYGGDEIGSEEVVTVLTLEWSSGMETLKYISRMDLTLAGSFADMILIPSAGANGSDTNTSLFMLSNPGQFFHVYGRMEGLESKTAAVISSTLTLPGDKKWPLTGGVSNHLSFGKDNTVHKLYVAGCQDGSIRFWDATYPIFSLLCILKNEVNGEKLVGSGASLTVLELCPSTLKLAVGRECGRVLLYNLCSSKETSFHFIMETKTEVYSFAQIQGTRCSAVFDLRKSGVRVLKFINNSSKLLWDILTRSYMGGVLGVSEEVPSSLRLRTS
ncbi:hypothetical protein ACS0TY_030367 [Phlomoides rotata]